MSEAIYLDHNATTPVADEVVDAMLPWLRQGYANPSSDSRDGRRARHAIDDARDHIRSLVGAPDATVVFTSGGTESNNLAVLGTLAARPDRTHVVTTSIEHPAVTEPCRHWEAQDHPVTWVPADRHGSIDARAAAAAIRDDTALVTVMLANNETGAVQPLETIAEAAHRAGAWVHSDGAQAVGKMPVDCRALGIDMLTLAGHKLYAPKGIGALVLRGVTPAPILFGARQEGGLRPGTENVASIVGLGTACALAAQQLEAEANRQRALTELLWSHLADHIPGLVRTVPGPARLPNTLHVRLPDAVGSHVLARAPEVAASTGSACHEGIDRPSDVLVAMGLSPDDALGALRLSVGRSTTVEAVTHAAASLVAAYRRTVRSPAA